MTNGFTASVISSGVGHNDRIKVCPPSEELKNPPELSERGATDRGTDLGGGGGGGGGGGTGGWSA